LEGWSSQSEAKLSVIVALILILAALFLSLQIAAALATVYLIVYGIRRMRKRRTS
jgi:predicted membrane protein